MTQLGTQPKVALSDDFLTAMMNLPSSQRKKAQLFMRNFRTNPTSSGFNYEKIANAHDPNMRSVRIDQTYRAIILKPEQGNVYVMLWVDHHDAAYQWAERKRCVVHPDTGSLQIFSVDVQEYVEPSEVYEDEEQPKLFDAWRDRELCRLGIPDELLPVVRQFNTQAELEKAAKQLPADVYEALFWLSEGDSLEDIHQALATDPKDAIDTTDFSAALNNPQSQRKFVIVEDDHALEQILDASLEKWRIFLHPMQRKIVEVEAKGPVRVLGGAGTGKTVVAMHRAAFLAKKVFFKEHDRILFTTFTRNLAADIEANLRKICDIDDMKRIEVVNIDQWVQNFLKRQGYPHQIKYFGSNDKTLEKLWQNALNMHTSGLDFPESFYREEWELVIQEQGCLTLRDYLTARRVGRGTPIQRADRKQIWNVFEEYRDSLNENGIRERTDAIRDACQILKTKGNILPYRAILIDEAQDMGQETFELIRQMIPTETRNDLFIVGDGHQRIYRRPVVMKHCGINIIGRNRSHRLRINYRTTDEIRKFAVRTLEGISIDNLDGGDDRTDQYKSLMHGRPPTIADCKSFEDELDAIIEFLHQEANTPGASTCLVARTQKLVDQYEQALTARGIATHPISRDQHDDLRKPGLRLATMHRVKGLEFNRVIIAGLSAEALPSRYLLTQTEDEAVREDIELRERALLYVAITRAKTDAFISYYGEPSPYLDISSTLPGPLEH